MIFRVPMCAGPFEWDKAMTRERVLDTSAVAVLLILTAMLARTPARGGRLDLPGTSRAERLESAARSLRHEVMQFAAEQQKFHAVRRAFAADLSELDFTVEHDYLALVVQMADSLGWTAAGVNHTAETVCVFSWGTGPAVSLAIGDISLDESYAPSHYERVGRCDEGPAPITPQVISRIPER